MRSPFARVFGLAFALLLSGCGNDTTSLLYEGIGVRMYQPDSFDRTLEAEKFFGLMCQRASIRTSSPASGVTLCEYHLMTPLDWRKIVYAGLDDVDERCDHYIESLTSARRDRDTFAKQLHDTATTTVSIVGLTSGASAIGVAVLQAAFGLAESSLDSYYSRLLLTLETTTVHGVVRKQQTTYRKSLAAGYIQHVSNKPTAYYAIRGYLRLCLPSTIESEVNAAITDVHYQDNGERQVAATTNPDLQALLAIPQTPRSATENVKRWTPGATETVPQRIGGAVGEELIFSRTEGMTVQSKLCVVAAADFGALDSNSPTRLAIKEYQAATTHRVSGQLTAVEFREIRDSTECAQSQYRNAFEKFRYSTAAKIRELQEDIKNAFFAAKGNKPELVAIVETGKFASGQLDERTREAFRAIHKAATELKSSERTFLPDIELARVPQDRMTPALLRAFVGVRNILSKGK
jgi:hypothetical protein